MRLKTVEEARVGAGCVPASYRNPPDTVFLAGRLSQRSDGWVFASCPPGAEQKPSQRFWAGLTRGPDL